VAEKGKKVVYQELLICDHKILIQSAVGLGGRTRLPGQDFTCFNYIFLDLK